MRSDFRHWHLADLADLPNARFAPEPDHPPSALLTPCGNSEEVEFDPCGGSVPASLADVAELDRSELVQNELGSPAEVRHASHRNEGSRL
jgi:hypothetical protein